MRGAPGIIQLISAKRFLSWAGPLGKLRTFLSHIKNASGGERSFAGSLSGIGPPPGCSGVQTAGGQASGRLVDMPSRAPNRTSSCGLLPCSDYRAHRAVACTLCGTAPESQQAGRQSSPATTCRTGSPAWSPHRRAPLSIDLLWYGTSGEPFIGRADAGLWPGAQSRSRNA